MQGLILLGELSEVFCELRHCLWYAVRPPAEGESARQYCAGETDPLLTRECGSYNGKRERDTLKIRLNGLISGVNYYLPKRQ